MYVNLPSLSEDYSDYIIKFCENVARCKVQGLLYYRADFPDGIQLTFTEDYYVHTN